MRVSVSGMNSSRLSSNTLGRRLTNKNVFQLRHLSISHLHNLLRASRISVDARLSSSRIIQCPLRIAVANKPSLNEKRPSESEP